MYPCEFDQNPPIGSLNRAQTTGYTNVNADSIRTKSNMSPSPYAGGHKKNKCYDFNLFLTVVKKGNIDYYSDQNLIPLQIRSF